MFNTSTLNKARNAPDITPITDTLAQKMGINVVTGRREVLHKLIGKLSPEPIPTKVEKGQDNVELFVIYKNGGRTATTIDEFVESARSVLKAKT